MESDFFSNNSTLALSQRLPGPGNGSPPRTNLQVPMAMKSLPLICIGHSRPVSHVQMAPNYILSGCKDGYPVLRDAVTGDWIGTYIGHKGATQTVRFVNTSSDLYVISTSADFTAKVWTLDGQLLLDLEHQSVVASADTVADPSSSNLFLITGTLNGTISLYSLTLPTSFDLLHTFQFNHKPIKSVLTFKNENKVIIVSEHHITYYDFDCKSYKLSLLKDITLDEKTGLFEIKNAKLIGPVGSRICVYSNVGDLEKEISLKYNASCVAFSNTWDTFITGNENDTYIRVHKVSGNGREEANVETEQLKGHHGPVHSIDFDQQDNVIISGSEDGTLRLWKYCGKEYGLWKTGANETSINSVG